MKEEHLILEDGHHLIPAQLVMVKMNKHQFWVGLIDWNKKNKVEPNLDGTTDSWFSWAGTGERLWKL